MEEIYKKIKIVNLNDVLIHEGIVEHWAERIANYIENTGVQRNPIIVCYKKGKYIVLDGMHRVRAMRLLGCKSIMVYIVDYTRDDVKVEGWDGLIFDKFDSLSYLNKVFSSPKFLIKTYKKYEGLHNKVINREIIFAIREKNGSAYTLELKNKDPKNILDTVISSIENYEFLVDAHKIKILYVPNSESYKNFIYSDATTLIVRPQFTKSEILDRTLHNKLFPRKSTRHIIPERPLRVDINLTILKENIPLHVKNKLLRAHLEWCWKSDHVRFYPESVYIFSD